MSHARWWRLFIWLSAVGARDHGPPGCGRRAGAAVHPSPAPSRIASLVAPWRYRSPARWRELLELAVLNQGFAASHTRAARFRGTGAFGIPGPGLQFPGHRVDRGLARLRAPARRGCGARRAQRGTDAMVGGAVFGRRGVHRRAAPYAGRAAQSPGHRRARPTRSRPPGAQAKQQGKRAPTPYRAAATGVGIAAQSGQLQAEKFSMPGNCRQMRSITPLAKMPWSKSMLLSAQMDSQRRPGQGRQRPRPAELGAAHHGGDQLVRLGISHGAVAQVGTAAACGWRLADRLRLSQLPGPRTRRPWR